MQRGTTPHSYHVKPEEWEQTGSIPPALGGSDAGRQEPGGDRNETEDKPATLEPKQLVPFLRTEFNFPAIDVYIESRFDQAGVTAILEDAGILPKIEDPNPYDLEHETVAYETWWSQYPEAQEAYFSSLDERHRLLRYLHIGAILGHLAGHDLYPGRTFPSVSAAPGTDAEA